MTMVCIWQCGCDWALSALTHVVLREAALFAWSFSLFVIHQRTVAEALCSCSRLCTLQQPLLKLRIHFMHQLAAQLAMHDCACDFL